MTGQSSTLVRDRGGLAVAAVLGLCAACGFALAPLGCFFAFWAIGWIVISLGLAAYTIPDERERRLAEVALIFTLATAFVVACLLQGLNRWFYPDTEYWKQAGERLLDAWQDGVKLQSPQKIALVTGAGPFFGFAVYDALHFTITNNPLLIAFTNIGLYGVSSVLVYQIAAFTIGADRALCAFLLLLLNPGGLYWCMFNLHDVLSMFLLVAFLAIFYRLVNRLSISGFLLLGGAMIAQLAVRPYLAVIEVGALTAYALIRSKWTTRLLLLAASLATLVVLAKLTHSLLQGKIPLQIGANGWIAAFAGHLEQARSLALRKNRWFIGRVGARKLPLLMMLSIGHFLFVPSLLNWKGDGAFLVPGNLFLYFELSYAILGFWLMLRHQPVLTAPLYLAVLGVLAVIAVSPILSEPRHRTVLLPVIAIAASIGLAEKSAAKPFLAFMVWFPVLVSTMMFANLS